jgi:hypothetical protein
MIFGHEEMFLENSSIVFSHLTVCLGLRFQHVRLEKVIYKNSIKYLAKL